MSRRASAARRSWWVCILLVALGLIQSSYLLSRVFALLTPSGPDAPDLCSILFAANCDATLSDGRYWVLNVPIAGWGLVYFTMLGGLLLLARLIPGAFAGDALLAALLLSLAGNGVGIALTVSGWAAHGTICPLCLSVHAI